MTLATSHITVYSTKAEFNAAFDADSLSFPCVCSYTHIGQDWWQCPRCHEWLPATAWRFYAVPDSYALCSHCAEGVKV